VKEAFDPDHKIRHTLLADLAADVQLLEDAGVEIRSGGTTVLDMFGKGQNKGHNVRAFTELKGWNTADCIYIGDALFPGGNDETVIGILPTHPVKDYRETYEFLSSLLA
jgi:hydroxymethylpyrimidine pyrophosphatase-like HAD family hydrolase